MSFVYSSASLGWQWNEYDAHVALRRHLIYLLSLYRSRLFLIWRSV